MALRPAISYNLHKGNLRVAAPAIEPCTEMELRTYLKMGETELPDEPALAFITMAREFIEEMTGLALIEQTWQLHLDRWPGYMDQWWDGVRETSITELSSGPAKILTFPRMPLIEILSVKVYDEADAEKEISVSSTFTVDAVSRPGRLSLKRGQFWPATTRELKAICIEYTAGFGDSAADVPATLRSAVLLFAAYIHEHRGECDMREAYEKSGANSLTRTFAVRGL